MVELYIDYWSQPSRAVLALCLVAGIPYTIKLTRIMEGGTRTPEYAELNPNRVVPTIKDGELVLYESNAILQYLAGTYSPQWYPVDPVIRARVDELLHWHHWNIRYGCGTYFYRAFVKPKLSGRKMPDDMRAELEQVQRKSLETLNRRAERGWLAGTEDPSIADLAAFTEIAQMSIFDFDISAYPALSNWYKNMRSIPGVLAAHSEFLSQSGLSKL